MMIFFLKKLRKLAKSIGKIEFKLIDRILLLENKLLKRSNNTIIKDSNFEKLEIQLKRKENYPKKLVIIICFFYNQKKISNLRKSVEEISLYKFRKDLTIITNQLSSEQEKSLNKLIKPKIKNFKIQQIKDLPDNNFLPWFSINLMRKKFKDTTNSHFMFLEDDIIVSSINICYWVFFRKILKNVGLIPGFLRFEKYKKNSYSIDNPKKLQLNKSPKILTSNNNFGFINSKYPYNAMYLMDRTLMKSYLNSDAVKIDFSFTNRIMKSLYPIKELLNVSYAYLNIPKGFHNRIVIPFDNNKKIFNYCLIEHSEVKYVKDTKLSKMGYGKIKVDNLIK